MDVVLREGGHRDDLAEAVRERAERPGLWVRAELPALNVDDWITVLRHDAGTAAERKQSLPEFVGADLDVGQFEALGLKFSDLKVVMRRAAPRWNLVLSGREVAGTADWSTPDTGMNSAA